MSGDEYREALGRSRVVLDSLSWDHKPRWLVNPSHLFLEDGNKPFAIAVECSCGWLGFIGGLELHVRDIVEKELNLTARGGKR